MMDKIEGKDRDVIRMMSLIERIEKRPTAMQAELSEERMLTEGVERKVETPDRLFDILSEIGKNEWVCIGYVSSANLDLPKVKRINPETNRMKSYDDWDTVTSDIGSEEPVAALVKITSYNFRYYGNDDMGVKYGEYKEKLNGIRGEYGLEPVADKENDYTEKVGYGSGVDVYSGSDDSKKGNFYVPANLYGGKVKGVYYAVNGEGRIIKELTEEQVLPYLKKKGEVSGVSALRKMGVEEDRIQQYIEAVAGLKMDYRRFEGNSILWAAATVGGQKIVYVNKAMAKSVNGINISMEDFVAKASERYNIDMASLE